MNVELEAHGVSFHPAQDNGKAVLFATIDEPVFLNPFSYWKSVHILRAEATETDFRSHPYTYAESFVLEGIAPVLHQKIENNNSVLAVVQLIEADKFDHPVTHKIFSFTYTKSIDGKIDWNGFDGLSLQKTAPIFTILPGLKLNIVANLKL